MQWAMHQFSDPSLFSSSELQTQRTKSIGCLEDADGSENLYNTKLEKIPADCNTNVDEKEAVIVFYCVEFRRDV